MTSKFLTIKSDPQKIYIHDLSSLETLNESISKYIKNQGDQQNYQTNVKAKMTEWNISSPDIEILKKIILNKFYEIDWHFTHKFKIESIWGNVYYEGDYALSHDHSPYYYSCVYFLKCDKNSSPLFFNCSRKKIFPKEGRLILFPSHLKHEVPKQKSKNERITIAANIEHIS